MGESIEVQLSRVEKDIFEHMNVQNAQHMQFLTKNEHAVDAVKSGTDELLRLIHLLNSRNGNGPAMNREASMRKVNEQRASALGITPSSSPKNGRPSSRGG